MKESLQNLFLYQTAEYRGKPLWVWNGELEEQELKRQIDIIQKWDLTDLFMHSRTGLKTEYLGKRWINLVDSCVSEAQKKGLEAWIYDEDCWPSGVAGGRVTEIPEYRASFISMKCYSREE